MTILDEWRLIMSEEKNFAFEGIILENTIIHRDSLRPKRVLFTSFSVFPFKGNLEETCLSLSKISLVAQIFRPLVSFS